MKKLAKTQCRLPKSRCDPEVLLFLIHNLVRVNIKKCNLKRKVGVNYLRSTIYTSASVKIRILGQRTIKIGQSLPYLGQRFS